MFNSLQDKLESAFKFIRGKGLVSEKDVQEAMKGVRLALLEADVNFKVAKDFCERVSVQAVGEKVLKSLSPEQQIIKIVNDELTKTMGAENVALDLNGAPPVVIMLVGLQGSGKTTTAGKLGKLLKSDFKRRPLLVPADVYRPAAITQLKTLAGQLELDVYDSKPTDDPVAIAKAAIHYAVQHALDTVIIDTAGRLQIDTELMKELQEISAAVQPQEILLVADAMTGQEAVNVAKGFDQALEIDGLILTKLDGDTRGGAALSMREVTGRPIKFIGVGEKLDALEVFYPDRMASRILGMGDVLSLIDKAKKEINLEDSMDLAKKMAKNEFTLEDFLTQMRTVKKLGSVSSLMGMIPGMGKLAQQVDNEEVEKEIKRIEAVVLSMTPKERHNHQILDGSRRKRIAKGSGTSVEFINGLIKKFTEMRKMMQQFSKMGLGGLMKSMGGAAGLAKGFPGGVPGMGDINNLFRGKK